MIRRRNLDHVEHCRKDVGSTHLTLDHFGGLCARKLEDQRDVKRGIVEENTVRLFVVISQSLSMISDHNDQRVFIPAVLLEMRNEIRQRRIRISNLAVV